MCRLPLAEAAVECRTGLLACLCVVSAVSTSEGQAGRPVLPYPASLPLDHPAIQYFQSPLDNAVTRLTNSSVGDLSDLLQRLGVSHDSQLLVFSKTSFQADKISPRNPRAIYFNDDVAVGWVRGSPSMEVAAFDPRQGVVFYTFNAEKPVFTRQQVCLRCHQGPATLGVPGIFVGSVYPNSAGQPSATAAIITDHRTPFGDRWGGWYVSAAHGEQADRANAVAPDPAEPAALEKLTVKFNPAGYLTPLSDIVALMTFEHQTQMTNLITRLGWEARIGGEPDIEPIVDYMLFADEARLREPVEGAGAFTRTFPLRGPRDRRGRSLRDFDLNTRLFRYPLSYMIYSAAFDALPDLVRERVYRRLYGILSGYDRGAKFAALSPEDRRGILEILGDTKTNLPKWWGTAVAGQAPVP
ncbi:MAG: hypothetical protein ABSG03_18110 [Bryobacteraceae bacterium]|jgi:hypothetical protein